MPIRLARTYLELATHKAHCEESAHYQNQRRYGTREGEQEIVDQIRQLSQDGKSLRSIARTLNENGVLPRKGKWFNQTVGLVLDNAKRGPEHGNKCRCRMFRTNWVKPGKWSVCWELLRLSDRTFEAMLAAGGIHYNTTINDIRNFRKIRLPPATYSSPPNQEPRPDFPFLNRIIFGDCLDLIHQLPDNSIDLAFMSPPYALQRLQYAGIAPADYPAWVVKWMTALWPKLKERGSVRIVLNSFIEDGEFNPYVLRTILAVIEAGWIVPGPCIWFKPDGGPFGAANRPRSNFEPILWFAKSRDVYVDLTACGKETKRKGFQTRNPHNNWHGDNEPVDGKARVTDVTVVNAGSVDEGIAHPAMFPPELARENIRTYAAPGGTILDLFTGPGTTCLVAQSKGYNFVGFDNGFSSDGTSYADMATKRLEQEPKYARGVAKREREEGQGGFK